MVKITKKIDNPNKNEVSKLIELYKKIISHSKGKLVNDSFNINILYLNILEIFNNNNNRKIAFDELYLNCFYLCRKEIVIKNDEKDEIIFENKFSNSFKDIIINDKLFTKIIQKEKFIERLWLKLNLSKIDSIIRKKMFRKKLIYPINKVSKLKKVIKDNIDNAIKTNEEKPENIEIRSFPEICESKLYNNNNSGIKINQNIFNELKEKSENFLGQISHTKINLNILEEKIKNVLKNIDQLMNNSLEYNKIKKNLTEKKAELSNLFDLINNEKNSLNLINKINNSNKNNIINIKNNIDSYKINYMKSLESLKDKMNILKEIENKIINGKNSIKKSLDITIKLHKEILNSINNMEIKDKKKAKELNEIVEIIDNDSNEQDNLINKFITKIRDLEKELKKIYLHFIRKDMK